MAKIQNRRLVQGIVDELGLMRNVEKVPEEITSKIVPTFDVAEKGVSKVLIDATNNDSDKSFVIPKEQLWEIEEIYLRNICTATVGSRNIRITVTDENGTEIHDTRSDSVQASGTFFYHFSPNCSTTDAGAGNVNHFMNYLKYLKGGWTVRIYDTTATDPTADDLHVYIHYKEFTGVKNG